MVSGESEQNMVQLSTALSLMVFLSTYVTDSVPFRAKATVASVALTEASDSPAVQAALKLLAERRAARQPFPLAPVPT